MRIEISRLKKVFGATVALDEVSTSVVGGEIRGICGQNGAGKSTLIKILSGIYSADSGEILIDGRSFAPRSPSQAFQHGIAVIHQELHLVSELSVAENLFLGHLPNQSGLVRANDLAENAEKMLSKIGATFGPWDRVGSLTIANRQLVEIAKALSRNPSVICFDEPTSSLSPKEVEALFELIRAEKQGGRIVLFVSHKMPEVESICDSVDVLRDGKLAAQFQVGNWKISDIVFAMAGSKNEVGFRRTTEEIESEIVLEIGVNDRLTVRKGQVVGIFGNIGAGKSSLLKRIFGLQKDKAGSCRFLGKEIRRLSVRSRIQSGMALCPEDRKLAAIFPNMNISDNISMPTAHFSGAIRNLAEEQKQAEAIRSKFSVKCEHVRQPIISLSGGNQQKTILGRWLNLNPKLLLLDEPTRGIDIRAREEIYGIIHHAAEKGAAVVMASSDVEELMAVCDEIVVMSDQKIMKKFRKEHWQESEILASAHLGLDGSETK